ncbi:MAG: Trm112 family protein [Hyphomicrobium sp.]
MSDPVGTGAASEQIDPRLLEVLVCPLTKATLQYDAKAQELISRTAGLAYPIRNGVPLMVIEAAREIDDKPRTTDHT